MGWIPTSGWLTKVSIDAAATDLAFDLAIDASGAGAPSRVMAGLDRPGAVVAARSDRGDRRRSSSAWPSRSAGSAAIVLDQPAAPAAVDGLSGATR